MHLINLAEYRSRKIAELLEGMSKLARVGEIRGVAFVAKFGSRDHRAGRAGDYRRNPEEALIAANLLENEIIYGPIFRDSQ